MKRIDLSPEIFLIEEVLTKVECEELILFAETKGFEEAAVNIGHGQQRIVKGVRNNFRLLHNDEAYAKMLWEKIKPFIPMRIGNMEACGVNELFRIYRYEPGQRFRRHRDGSFERNDKEWSLITFMIYLNENFEGGDTTFDLMHIKPQTGMALCFNHPILHEGTVVTQGIKYALRTDIMYRLLPVSN